MCFFLSIIILQLRWTIEPKLSQDYYCMHVLGYTKWEDWSFWQLPIVSNVFKPVKTRTEHREKHLRCTPTQQAYVCCVFLRARAPTHFLLGKEVHPIWGHVKFLVEHFKGTEAMTWGMEAITFVASVEYQACPNPFPFAASHVEGPTYMVERIRHRNRIIQINVHYPDRRTNRFFSSDIGYDVGCVY